ncbi:urease accessory protein UreD [Methylobacterium sp. sgz302541]|uniref:urease accessory protein UreD n=1 Tax=unclassified Methylobacterium TaxID=2615210 RepID=UPI003D33117E
MSFADEGGPKDFFAIHAPFSPPAGTAPARQRSVGRVALKAGASPTRVLDLAESGPLRLRFPNTHGEAREGVIVNTAGGIACGDRFCVSVELEERADFVLTTTAAEKVYRSDGPVAEVENRVRLDAGTRLAWLPQETILFDRARLRRRFEADLAGDAELFVCEIVAFGRAAHRERIAQGFFEDIWRIRRDGRLTYADTLRLDGPIADLLERSAIGGGAAAMATLLDLSPKAESRIEEARAHLDAAVAETPGVEAGASAWNGHLAIRLLGPDIAGVRRVAIRLLTAWRDRPMPRVWQA